MKRSLLVHRSGWLVLLGAHQGADVISGFVRDAVRAQVPELAAYLR